MANDKLPPHDIEAEEAVIGSLLIDPDAILKIAASLKPEDFFSETNRAIYQACFSLYQPPVRLRPWATKPVQTLRAA
jgi:replicative DNA helicase